jgi:hypothetical protein
MRNYFKRYGERGKIGQLVKVSLRIWNRIERYDPEGSKGPGGERKFERQMWNFEIELGNG